MLQSYEQLEEQNSKLKGKYDQIQTLYKNMRNDYCLQLDRNVILTKDNERLQSGIFTVSKILDYIIEWY